jgi:hypothetical protein
MVPIVVGKLSVSTLMKVSLVPVSDDRNWIGSWLMPTRRKFDLIAVWKIDRFGRSLTCHESGSSTLLRCTRCSNAILNA